MQNSQETFLTQKPKSKVLQRHISYYYFHKIKEKKITKKIVFYPNTINAITIYKNSKLDFGENSSFSKPISKEDINYYYGGISKAFRISEIQSPFDKIGIVFQPLGLNFFLDKPLLNYISQENDLTFDYFKSSMDQIIHRVYLTDNIDEKIALLDEYFIERIFDFEEKYLIQAICFIENSDKKLKVSEVVQNIDCTYKTLSRKFQKHLNCTIKEYLEVSLFRKSFNYYLNQNNNGSLSNLAHDFNYYDQSEFINQFKKRTGINPKKLFKNIDKFGKENLFWNTKL